MLKLVISISSCWGNRTSMSVIDGGKALPPQPPVTNYQSEGSFTNVFEEKKRVKKR